MRIVAAIARSAGRLRLLGSQAYHEAQARQEHATHLDREAATLRERGLRIQLYRSTRGWIGADGRPATPDMIELYERMKA